MKKSEENTTPIEDVETDSETANCEVEVISKEEIAENEVTITEAETATETKQENPEIPETPEKLKLTFDQKVDKVAIFIKKYKIAILCGLIAIVALIVGIAIGGAFGGNETTAETDYIASQNLESEDEDSDTYISTPSPTTSATEAPSATSSVSSGSSVTESSSSAEESESTSQEVATPTTTSVYYSDLLTTPVYFETEIQMDMQESDVIELLNNVLEENDEVVLVEGEEGKTPLSDSVSVDVTKEEMLNLLQDTNATFVSIDQSVSGNVLTLEVDMNIQIPDEVLTELKSNFIVSLALSMVSSDLSFSYTVSYEMDGEKLVPIEIADSTISIAGQNTSTTETIAGIALSNYSDASADVLLVGYNNMAGEIIADILNNYGVITGADSSVISVTTRTE
ncbi:MAG: hypothetical protein R3Y32_00410 [Bacillota bacterium]